MRLDSEQERQRQIAVSIAARFGDQPVELCLCALPVGDDRCGVGAVASTASGGGLFVHTDDEPVLVGIISTVANDLSTNGVVPLASLAELLRQPQRYRYPTDTMTSGVETTRVRRN